MYDEEKDEESSARYNCLVCRLPVENGLLSQDGEAVCLECAGNIGVDELLMLCDCKSVAELLVSLGYSEL